ncbi:putative disease resistance protein RGA3 [Hordeum vulgare]|nr:putative disease resistance protein RGA3 [Hordeum vulgare]
MIIAEYDGFKNPESVKLDKIETWCQTHLLPDMVLKREQFVRTMAQRIGEVVELQIVLPNGFIGEFIRVRVKIDITKKLTRFVGFTKARETEYYQVKFEKLLVFCYMCGLLGHWHEECGSGEHDSKDMEWGPFILAARRTANANRSVGRGFGRGSERDAGGVWR